MESFKKRGKKKNSLLNSIIYTWELLESILSHKLPILNLAVRKCPHKLTSMGAVSGKGSVSWQAGGIQASSEYARPHVTSSGRGILVPPEASPGVTFAPQTALVPCTSVAGRLALTSGASPILLQLRQLQPGPASGPGAEASGIL